MYIQRINRKQNGKVYTSIILTRSYRDNGKQKRETLAVLTKWPKHLITALEAALKNKTATDFKSFEFEQGKSYGALYIMNEICKRLGITEALNRTSYGKITLLQIMARILNNGSQRAIGNWAELNAVEEILEMEIPSLDDCYNNLSILQDRQKHIENKIYKFQHQEGKPINIYLYDVTSSYFEGQKNELSAFGYNRDGKKGKKQIVIGLLCDETGDPISVEVFKGNTNDLNTFSSQLQKVKQRFNIQQVVMVGDKGMIKKVQIDDIIENGFSYITTITKGQIQSLIRKGVFQLEMFDDAIVDVQDNQDRYVIRCNPVRKEEIAFNREQKIVTIKQMVEVSNLYLSEHPRAKIDNQTSKINNKIKKLKLSKALNVSIDNSTIQLDINNENLTQLAALDGCYAMKTNLCKQTVKPKVIHDRYKDLAHVEYAFKNIKTEQLHVRPIYLRREDRTRAHVFVCSLAYKVIKYLREKCSSLDYTLNEILDHLKAIHYIVYDVNGVDVKLLPSKLNKAQQEIFDVLSMRLPRTL